MHSGCAMLTLKVKGIHVMAANIHKPKSYIMFINAQSYMCCLCSVCMLAMVMQASVINSKPECLTLMDEFFPLFLYMLASVNLTYDCSVVGNCDIIW